MDLEAVKWHGSAWRFAKATTTPGRWIVNALGFAVGAGAIAVVGWGLREPTAAGLMALALAGVLLAVTGVRLQHEKDLREASSFEAELLRERVPHGWDFRIRVTNRGPRTTFYPSITEIQGVPESWHAAMPYVLPQPLWRGEGRTSREEIERGGSRFINLATLANGKQFWFWTSENAQPDPGFVWTVPTDTVPTISFLLTIRDAEDHHRQWIGRFTLPTVYEEPEVSLESCDRTD